VGSISNNRAVLSGGGRIFATVDPGVSDGTFEMQYLGAPIGTRVLMPFRYQDLANHLMVSVVTGGSSPYWGLYKREAGSGMTVKSSGVEAKPGDRIGVRMQGTSITLRVNGVDTITETMTLFPTATRVGFGDGTVADPTPIYWDNATFTAIDS
jgi:hypothetical protein